METINKGKAGQIGEIRTWAGKKYQKTAKGWRPVAGNSSKTGAKEPEPKKEAPSKAGGNGDVVVKDWGSKKYVKTEKGWRPLTAKRAEEMGVDMNGKRARNPEPEKSVGNTQKKEENKKRNRETVEVSLKDFYKGNYKLPCADLSLELNFSPVDKYGTLGGSGKATIRVNSDEAVFELYTNRRDALGFWNKETKTVKISAERFKKILPYVEDWKVSNSRDKFKDIEGGYTGLSDFTVLYKNGSLSVTSGARSNYYKRDEYDLDRKHLVYGKEYRSVNIPSAKKILEDYIKNRIKII